MIAARADLVLLATRDGGLKSVMGSPCRSLILHATAGPGIGAVALGVLISTPLAEPPTPGAAVTDARLDFWVDLADLYLVTGQQLELGYPIHVVGSGTLTAVFPASS